MAPKKIVKIVFTICLVAIVFLSVLSVQAQAAPKSKVTFAVSGLTNYDDLVFTIDGNTYTYWDIPTTFNWDKGSTHQVTVATPVTGWDGIGHRFSSWTNGNGLVTESGTLTVPDSDVTVTANYVQNTVHVYFRTSGITNLDAGQTVLTIDYTDYDYWEVANTNFIWEIDSVHNITAASPITGWDSVVNSFSSWTNGNGLTGVSGTFTTPSEDTTVTANYGITSVNVEFAVSGISNYDNDVIIVDGTGYNIWNLPTMIWSIGSTHSVEAPTPITGWDSVTHVFQSWTNGNGLTTATGTLTTPDSDVTVTANYGLSSSPAETALNVTCTPNTVDRTVTNNTIISGQLTSSCVGVAGKTISLAYLNTTTYIPIATVTTQSDGTFSYNWEVPAYIQNGEYTIQAQFAGDSNYEASSANTGSGSNGPNLFVLPEYELGTITAIIACFAAVLLFKKRSTLKK
ncbi:MAG: hypothetical protein NWF01_08575 [Candidatus Bathyarchaeota archaeon]|nr:hypothetical protein [Candidatus Bathyarchaeota archaeon]